MHHLIYPSKDTYITNKVGFDNKNFGIDEILEIGTNNIPVRTLSPTKNYTYINAIFNHVPVTYFTGIFTGSFGGTVLFATGSISGSGLVFSSSYFSGSVNGVTSVISGSVSGSLVNGMLSGSVISPFSIGLFTGQLTGSNVCLYGTGSGIDVRNEPNWTTATTKYISRALLKFDLTNISTSISNGNIAQPNFSLKLKISKETDLPINYVIYALPISQSWNMGDGYFSDNGSDEGVSWDFRDNNYGTPWFSPAVSGTRPPIDFISNPSLATASFGYGGGTWFTSSVASQSFGYTTADINMDVTTMVLSWLSGSIPNEGCILVSSDELQSTGSGFVLKFFSRDTNTIYSPTLDIKWSDAIFGTGSLSTSSVQISTASAGINATIQSGSSLTIAGGVSGSFSASAFITLTELSVYFTTFYDAAVLGTLSGSLTGSFQGSPSYVSGLLTGSNLAFSASYFLGTIDGNPLVNFSGSITGSNINGFISGSVIAPTNIGLFTGLITGSNIFVSGTASYFILADQYSGSGFIDGTGFGGNILGDPVFGFASASITVSSSLVTGPCGNNFLAQMASGTFYDGPFSGSMFTAYYVDYKFENGFLTGSWIPADLLGEHVFIQIPSGIDPFAFAFVSGPYVNGKALGKYILSGSTSASFSGQFVDGNLVGATINLQLSGSAYTSSFSFTSSVNLTSSVLAPLDVERPFTITLQNVHSTYKEGDMAKIGVFGRKAFPLKQFGKSTQQEQYLVPEFLPTSSFYAIKDNQTEEIVIDFDSYTRIGCEYPNGNFFILDTTSLLPERYYRILIQVQDSQTTYTFDTGKTFKITR
jgi:hypothetical protein